MVEEDERQRLLEDRPETQRSLDGNAGEEALPEKEKVVKRKKPSDGTCQGPRRSQHFI